MVPESTQPRKPRSPRRILITGTSRGLGRALAEHFLRQGDQVIGCSRSDVSVDSPGYQHFATDLSDASQIDRMMSAIRGQQRAEMAEKQWSEALKNILKINGHKAVVEFDPELNMFRGEFLGLNGGADFYANSVEGLEREGEKSLSAFLEVCAEKSIEPTRSFSGRFNIRIAPQTHQAAVMAARAQGKSLNEWVADAIEIATEAD